MLRGRPASDGCRAPVTTDDGGAIAPVVDGPVADHPGAVPALTRLGAAIALARHFPYTEYLAVFAPLLAWFYSEDLFHTLAGLAYLLPCILNTTAGFIYNNLMDRRDPFEKPNPFVHGTVTVAYGVKLLVICLALELLSFVALYRSPWAYACFAVYLFLSLAYSGLGLRFKERASGPLVAGFVVWVGGALVLCVELRAQGWMYLLLAGAWLIGVAREIFHMLLDYKADLSSGFATFAVRAGPVAAHRALRAAIFGGAGLLVASLAAFSGWSPAGQAPWWAAATVLVALGLAFLPVADHREPLRRSPFLAFRLFYFVFAAYILALDPLATGLVVWAFVTSKRS